MDISLHPFFSLSSQFCIFFFFFLPCILQKIMLRRKSSSISTHHSNKSNNGKNENLQLRNTNVFASSFNKVNGRAMIDAMKETRIVWL